MNRLSPEIRADGTESPSSLGFQEFIEDTSTSALGKYQDLMVGDRSLWRLFKFEALTLALMNLPGLLGLFSRQKLYRALLRDVGNGTAIGTGVSLRQPGRVSIGRSCVIDDRVSLHVRGSGAAGIRLADDIFIGRGTILKVREGRIDIEKSANISSQCRIAAYRGEVRIGSYSLVAAYCYIGGGNHKTDRLDIPMALQGRENRGGVTIEDDVWIGAHTMVADGVTIGRGSIIGTGSYVNKDIPEYSIAFGSPASVYKKRV